MELTPGVPYGVVIVMGYQQDPDVWRGRFRKCEVFDSTPYGYGEASADLISLSWARSHPEGRWSRRVRSYLFRILGFDILHVWRNRGIIRQAQIVWTHTEREHLAVAALLALRTRRARPKVLAQSVWLWDTWQEASFVRKRLIAALLKVHTVEVVHSSTNLEVSRAQVPGRHVVRIPFGTSVPNVGSHDTERNEPDLVVAFGNDIDRDWELLKTVAEALPSLRFRVASSSPAARKTTWPANVDVRPARTTDEVNALYGAASCVAVPLKPNFHASGATSVIEAIGTGRPLVVSQAGGIDEYVDGHALLVPVGDTEEFTRQILTAIDRGNDGAAGPEVVRQRGLRQVDYLRRYERISQFLAGDAPWDPAVESFTEQSQA